MLFNSIITEVYESGLIKELIGNMRVKSSDADDLEQEIYMILLQYDKEKIIELHNKKQLKFFIVRIIQNQYNSNTSPFYKKYKKYYTIVDENQVNAEEIYNEETDDIYDNDGM